MSPLGVLVGLSLAMWLGLLGFRGGFWRADQRLGCGPPGPVIWPSVSAIVPARDEAATIGRAVASLLAQDYPGQLRLVVVDDASTDGTADAARATGDERLLVVAAAALRPGWTGKMNAVAAGVAAAGEGPRYLLLTDADIEHGPGHLKRLVAKAEAEHLDLVSLMVMLRADSGWERLLIPAFVFFFQKLYPFARVNNPARPEAAAAGGCLLVRRLALAEAGGIEAIKGQIIDDCALARLLKARGPIWLGLSTGSRSLRAYDALGDIWNMVARTAFVQLRRSPWLLAGTLLGMALLYLAPPLAVGLGDGLAAGLGAAAWAAMAVAYWPTLRLYGLSPAWAAALPLAGVLYGLMTLSSAMRHWSGRGAGWKGRHYGI